MRLKGFPHEADEYFPANLDTDQDKRWSVRFTHGEKISCLNNRDMRVHEVDPSVV